MEASNRKTTVGCAFAECDWTGTFPATDGGAQTAIEARRDHIAEAHPGPTPDALPPSLPEFLAAVKRDDAALGREMPDPVEMWGVINPHAGDSQPLALFPDEHAAWRWLLSPGGLSGGPRGRFATPPDALRVRSFMVSAAVLTVEERT